MDHPAKPDHLVVHELDDELLLYDPTVDRSHRLNPSATVIWQLCDGSRSIEDIARALTTQYVVDYEDALKDAEQAVAIMGEERIVTFVPAMTTHRHSA